MTLSIDRQRELRAIVRKTTADFIRQVRRESRFGFRYALEDGDLVITNQFNEQTRVPADPAFEAMAADALRRIHRALARSNRKREKISA